MDRSIDGTFVNVENECAKLCAQIEAEKKKIRITQEMIGTVEARIAHEEALNKEEDNRIEALLNEIDKLKADNQQKKLDIDCLKISCQNTDDIINNLLVELNAKQNEREEEQKYFEDVTQTFRNDYEIMKQSYVDVPVNPTFNQLATIATEHESSNHRIDDQLDEEDVHSSQTTDKLITDDLAEDLQNRGDMRSTNAEEVAVDVTNAGEEIGLVDKQMDEQIAKHFMFETNSQIVDTEKRVTDSSGEPQSQQIGLSGEMCAMFDNLFQPNQTADEDINSRFEFSLNLGDTGDNSSIASSPSQSNEGFNFDFTKQ